MNDTACYGPNVVLQRHDSMNVASSILRPDYSLAARRCEPFFYVRKRAGLGYLPLLDGIRHGISKLQGGRGATGVVSVE